MGVMWAVIIGGIIVFAIVAAIHDHKAGIPQARAAALLAQRARIVCPHCQTAGKVTTKPMKVKRGISGGKATGAILTGGVSMLATGLSRKEATTQCRCGNCGMTWNV